MPLLQECYSVEGGSVEWCRPRDHYFKTYMSRLCSWIENSLSQKTELHIFDCWFHVFSNPVLTFISRLLDASAVPDGRSLDLTLVLEYIDQDLSTYLSKVTAPGLSRDCIKVRTQLTFCQNKSTVVFFSAQSLHPITNIQPENWNQHESRSVFVKKKNISAVMLLFVCAGCDAAAAARTGLPAHKHGASPWPKTWEHPRQQPRRSQDRRLWTGSHLHLQHRSDSGCKWGSTQPCSGKRCRDSCFPINIYITFCSVCFLTGGKTILFCSSSLPSGCVTSLCLLRWWRCGTELLRCCSTLFTCPQWTCGAPAASSLSSSSWGEESSVCVWLEEIRDSREFNIGGKTRSAVIKIASWCLFSCRPLFRGYTEVQQLQKIFEWVLFFIYFFVCCTSALKPFVLLTSEVIIMENKQCWKDFFFFYCSLYFI